jgi:hypothetical protein
MATVQRNAIIAPFSVNTPLTDKKGKVADQTQQRWLQSLADGINGSAQVTATIPTSSASPGQPGTFAFDSGFLYIAVGQNIWRRVALNSF